MIMTWEEFTKSRFYSSPGTFALNFGSLAPRGIFHWTGCRNDKPGLWYTARLAAWPPTLRQVGTSNAFGGVPVLGVMPVGALADQAASILPPPF